MVKSQTHFRSTFAEISLFNLAYNIKTLRSSLPENSFFCPMVKANAYGHGDVEIAKALQGMGVTHLGVISIDEALVLREAGVNAAILIYGFFDKDGAQTMLEYQMTPVLSDWSQIKILERLLSGTERYPAHIKFNTGMSRMGFDISEASKLAEYFKNSKQFRLEGVCTHFLNGEDLGQPDGHCSKQLKKFEEALLSFKNMQVYSHWLNSSALALHTDYEFSPLLQRGARPGLAMYGVQPVNHKNKVLDLKPVMQLKSQIAAIQNVKKGEVVSYGARWVAKRDSVIGVVPVGYADGYLRLLTNQASMLVSGHRVPVAGTVCMDYTMIDLTELVSVVPQLLNQEVVVFGTQQKEQLHVNELASLAQTIPYEILVRIAARVPKIYKHT